MSVPVVLIPGAGGQAWVWHLVEADLRRRGYDAFAVDLPADLRQVMAGHDVPQSPGPFGDICAFDGWPDLPLHVIAGRDDRFFPVELQQRIARERLGVEPDVVPGGHLAALSRPAELAAALARYL